MNASFETFDHLSSRNRRINIRLENFRFFHQATSDKQIDPKYIERQAPEHQLRNWLEYNETCRGVYLVTGYRGMGKSSLVGKVLRDLNKDYKEQYQILHVNLGQENIEEKEILRIVCRMLYEKYCCCISKRIIAYNIFKALKYGLYFLIPFILLLGNKDFTVPKYVETIKDYSVFIAIGLFVVPYIVEKVFFRGKAFSVFEKLKKLCERLNATVSLENRLDFKHMFGFSKKESINYPVASIQELEFELKQVLSSIREVNNLLKVVIVLDELDKAEPEFEGYETDEGKSIPEYEKVSAKPDTKTTTRARRRQVLRIIANMKFFLSSAQAYFIFIAGRELYEAFQADMSDRDFSISSIFSNVLNVDSFLVSTRKTNNTALLTEQFVCKQLLPDDIDNVLKSTNDSFYDRKNVHSLKNYYNYRRQNPKRSENAWRDVFFLYHFTHYLAYISNGSPKKMSIFFEKCVREYDYLKTNDKLEDLPTEREMSGKAEFYLSFGYYTQQKINFIHYLTYPVMQSIINLSNMYGDKLLVSASFLISHIYKFHNNGFSWRNLEQTPELLEINKTPEIREFISSIIDYLNHTHLTTIPCGLYQYKFPMRITEEISYFSKVSSEISSLFNFSLDQLKTIKEHYTALLQYHKIPGNNDSSVVLYNQESIHHSLGDMYMMEENYSRAIREYGTCVDLVLSGNKNAGAHFRMQNDVLFMTRTMLKLGLAHEKRRTDNSAFVVYQTLIDYLKEKKLELNSLVIFEDVRIMYLALLAKLYVLEKIDTEGIQECHIEGVVKDFKHILESNKEYSCKYDPKKKKIVCSDFYRKLGDILYYKNPNSFKNLLYGTAYAAYTESLGILCYDWICEEEPGFSRIEDYSTVDKDNLSWYLFKISFKKVGFNTDSSNNSEDKRDNYLYNIALTCEALGHVCFSDHEKDQNVYREEFWGKFVTCLEASDREKAICGIEPKNNMERSILYYWTASRFYNASCERGLASRCYKEIIFVVSSYMDILLKKDKLPKNNCFSKFLDKVVHHLLISKFHQYEHIHLSEINSLKWMQGHELYEYIELGNLSISPDIEEIVYAYYMIKLDLAIAYLKRFKEGDTTYTSLEEAERKSIVKFYRSNLMTGKMMCKTLTSSVLNLRLKACINEYLLSLLLCCEKKYLLEVQVEDLIQYQDREDILSDKWISDIFKTEKLEQQNNFDRNFDILEFLICDGHFCLSRILEKIIPLRNTTLFNNSFKGDIYYHLLRFTHLYKVLYCYYSYGKDQKTDDLLDIYLRNESRGQQCVESSGVLTSDMMNAIGRNVMSVYAEPNEAIHVSSFERPVHILLRRNNFLDKMLYSSKKSNPSKAVKVYLAENAIYYYTKAWQVHNQGKSYQIMIRNLHFLDDDLNNNTCQFYMAKERFLIKEEILQSRIKELKQMYEHSYYYNISSYFVKGDNSVEM